MTKKIINSFLDLFPKDMKEGEVYEARAGHKKFYALPYSLQYGTNKGQYGKAKVGDELMIMNYDPRKLRKVHP